MLTGLGVLLPALAESDEVIQLNNKAMIIINQGAVDEAIALLTKALTLEPESIYIQANLAKSYLEKGNRIKNPSESIRFFHKAAYFNRFDSTINETLNACIRRQGLDPNSFVDRVALGKKAEVTGDSEGSFVENDLALLQGYDNALYEKTKNAALIIPGYRPAMLSDSPNVVNKNLYSIKELINKKLGMIEKSDDELCLEFALTQDKKVNYINMYKPSKEPTLNETAKKLINELDFGNIIPLSGRYYCRLSKAHLQDIWFELDWTYYFRDAIFAILFNWSHARDFKHKSVSIMVQLDRLNGTAITAKIEKTSGDIEFDKSALQAVEKAASKNELPKPPAEAPLRSHLIFTFASYENGRGDIKAKAVSTHFPNS